MSSGIRVLLIVLVTAVVCIGTAVIVSISVRDGRCRSVPCTYFEKKGNSFAGKVRYEKGR